MKVDKTALILDALKRRTVETLHEISDQLEVGYSTVCAINRKHGYLIPQRRRWGKTPIEAYDKYRELLRTTDLSASQCAVQAGFAATATTTPTHAAIRNQERRYISRWRWVVVATGEIRPVANPCPIKCATRKTGMSAKTLYRRAKDGLLTVRKAPSDGSTRLYDPKELALVKEIGLNPSESAATLSRDDVEVIRILGKEYSHAFIAHYFPVTRRQIGRIVDGTRWKRRRSLKQALEEISA